MGTPGGEILETWCEVREMRQRSHGRVRSLAVLGTLGGNARREPLESLNRVALAEVGRPSPSKRSVGHG
jgi:hypothetical protein